MNRGLALAGGAVLALLVVAVASAAPTGSFTLSGTVSRVVDGDTLDVRLRTGKVERVRLIGIDAPERGECFYSHAAARVRALALRKKVVLRGDASQARRDRYRRVLAYVDIAGRRDLGAQLLRDGVAEVYMLARPFQRLSRYRAAQTVARSSLAGMWTTCATPKPEPPPTPAPKVACGDGIDNDADGFTDALDSGCNVPADESEDRPDIQCDDGADNDGDGRIDFPVDPDCSSNLDTTEAAATPPPSANCDPSYPTVCIPPPPPDLDCGEIPYGDFLVVGSDPHRFDGDRDGLGCES